MTDMTKILEAFVTTRAKYEAAVRREVEAQIALSAASKAADEAGQARHTLQADLATVLDNLRKAAF